MFDLITKMVKNMELRKNDIYDLPVKEKRIEGDSLCYIVEFAGKEYGVRLFKFQKEDPLPDKISCLVKDIDERGPVLVQNYGQLLPRFYEEGRIYTFWVRRDLSDAMGGYYEVGDKNGFYFRLQTDKRIKLQISQEIECRVALLKGNRLNLRLTDDESCNRGNYPFRPLEEMIGMMNMTETDARWLTKTLLSTQTFAEVREALLRYDEEWMKAGIKQLAERLDEWVELGGRHRERWLNICRRICLFLLEDSDFLDGCADERRFSIVELLSQTMRRIEEYMEAVRMLASGEDGCYVDDLLAKMKKSGNLYRSEEKLDVLHCIFRLDRQSLTRKIQPLLDVIIGGPSALRIYEPYRDVFIKSLSLYIDEHSGYIDRMGGIESEEEASLVRSTVMSLAVLLLLVREEDRCKWRLKRARLYRYLTFLKESSSSLLLEKAFGIIANDECPKLEFEWKDVRELAMLIVRLSYPLADGREGMAERVYEDRQVRLCIKDGDISLRTAKKVKKQWPCISEGLLPWHHLQVQLSGVNNRSVPSGTKDLAPYQQLWRNAEQELFDGTDVLAFRPGVRKVMPEIGDKVRIRVVKQESRNPNYFLCRIEDDMYEGEGVLCTNNIVRYGLRTDVGAFTSDSGKPYLFQAVVQSRRKDGGFNFRLVELLDTFIYQSVYVGEIVTCVVAEVQKYHYFCICNYGYGLFIPILPGSVELRQGDFLEAEINEVRTSGAVMADFLRQTAPTFIIADAFANLIYSYADEQVYEEAVEEEMPARREDYEMDKSSVCELMHIIDRVAMLEENYVKTYNYLGFARILAILLDKEELGKSFLERMRLLQMLQQFAVNGQMDMKELKMRNQACHDLLPSYPLLQSDMLDMLVLGSLDSSAQNNFLWKVLQQGGNERRVKLAKLVLAYNLLEASSMDGQQDAICAKIYDVLNMDVGKHVFYSFGSEGQNVEFKTSIVYSPEKGMRANLPKQTQEIMSVICGFLNADGGTLYLGVNDEGVASGLDADIAYFNGSLDKFDLHVRNSVVRYLGMEANAKITVSYPLAGKKQVYAMDIKPCLHPVMCDGVCYQRQGSSTWSLQGDALNAFLKSKCGTEELLPQPEDAGAVAMPLEILSETIEASPEKADMPEEKPVVKKASEAGEIATGLIRANATHSWMDGFGVSTVRYLHLLSENGYLMTQDECWRNDVLLSMAIHEDESDGYLINVFESGRIVRVSMADLLDKKLDKEYKRYGQDRLVFSCPAHKDDALLTIMSDVQQRPAYRMDDIECLKDGNMLAKGDFASVVETTGVLRCEVIPAARKPVLKRIHNMKPTLIGLNLSTYWGGEELKELEAIGIKPELT